MAEIVNIIFTYVYYTKCDFDLCNCSVVSTTNRRQ